MWSPLAKSSNPDQRDPAVSDKSRRESGSSAAPNLNPDPDALHEAKEIGTPNLQQQEPAPAEPDSQDEQPSAPSAETNVPQTEQRDDNISAVGDKESAVSGSAKSAESSGGLLGKIKSLAGLGRQDTRTDKDRGGDAGSTFSQSILRGLPVRDGGKVPGPDGTIVGEVVEGGEDAIGGTVDEGGKIVDDAGKTIGQTDLTQEVKDTVEQAKHDKSSGEKQEDVKRPVDNVSEEAEGELPPLSSLEGLTCNKMGKIISSSTGKPVGELVEGDPKKISRLGSKLDNKGQFWDSRGNVIGRAKTLQFEDYKDEPPFAGLEELRVVQDGFVEDAGGSRVDKLTEGNPAKLIGRPVDEDGDIMDQFGSVKGHAEPYEAPEEEQPDEEDLSILEGKIVNKAGNIVDEHGKVYGRITSGDKRLAGRKVDGKGQIWSDDGKVIGKAELIPGAEQESPEGEFYGFENIAVGKDGAVTDASGRVVGRVIEGDAARLSNRKVDEDGDILNKNGNVVGRAERWEPEEKKRNINPMAGRKITREGEVRDVDGNLIGKLTSGDLNNLIGKEIDDNGYVVDNDGNKIGECTLLENLPDEEPAEEPAEKPEGPSPEELAAQKKEQEDKDLARKMTAIVSQTLDRLRPICKMITEHIDKAERTPKDELDEEQLVKNVKPLLEEGNNLLQECNGAIRALDADGRIAATAKARAASHEASPEEYTLADKLKELTDTVVRTIDNGKRKIQDMPHAKKQLNPLWALLSEPLFQIIAAVGLLLTGVLGLVGRLLEGLGLGPLVHGLLGGLGLDKLLGSLGLTSLTDALGLTGNKK